MAPLCLGLRGGAHPPAHASVSPPPCPCIGAWEDEGADARTQAGIWPSGEGPAPCLVEPPAGEGAGVLGRVGTVPAGEPGLEAEPLCVVTCPVLGRMCRTLDKDCNRPRSLYFILCVCLGFLCFNKSFGKGLDQRVFS